MDFDQSHQSDNSEKIDWANWPADRGDGKVLRLRSNLTGGSLYGRRRESVDSSWRRLRTLSFALIAILLLMQQASDPAIYRNLFLKLGVPLSEEQPSLAAPPASVAVPPPRDASLDREPGAQLLESLEAESRQMLKRLLIDFRRGPDQAGGDDEEDLKQLRTDLLLFAGTGSLSSDEERRVRDWAAALAKPESEAGQAAIGNLEAWLQPAFDQSFLQRVRDASVWHPDDAEALYRLLEKAERGNKFASATAIGVTPLLEQAPVYRGREFHISGTAVRAEEVAAPTNDYGITSYWMVWLNPDDGSKRPLVGYCPDVPPAVRQLDPRATTLDGPHVALRGVYVKRLLYQSSAGAELAPLIVGTLALRQPAAVAEEVATTSVRLVWILLAAVAAAALFAIGVYWVTQRDSIRRRKIRQLGKPAFDANRDLESFGTRRSTEQSE